MAVFLIDQEYTAEEILNNNDIDIEKLREEYSNDNQKKFCCKHSKQANNLVTLAISRITGKSENDIGKRKTLIFGSSRLYDAIDDYKS